MKKLTEEKLESTTLSHPPVAAKGLTQQKKLYKYPTDANPEPRKLLDLTEINKPDHLIYLTVESKRTPLGVQKDPVYKRVHTAINTLIIVMGPLGNRKGLCV